MTIAAPADLDALDYWTALRLSRAARAENDRVLAVRAAKRALDRRKTRESYVAVGRAFRDVGASDLAEACYRESLKLDPSFVTNRFAYLALTAVLRSNGSLNNLQQARYLARRVVEHNPGDPVAEDTFAALDRQLSRLA